MTTVKIVAVAVLLCGYLWGVETTKRQVNVKLTGLVTALEEIPKNPLIVKALP